MINKIKKKISYLILIIIIPLVVIGGGIIFKEKRYAFVSIAVIALACVPFFIVYEKKSHNTSQVIILGVMTALCIIGRVIFAFVPGFKPVSAMVIITGIYLGSECGFMSGALTALISNFYFGQGPWTPFQMLTWGLIGLFAGMLAESLKSSKVRLSIYGALSGVLYSFLMDFWSMLWADGGLNLKRYVALLGTSAVFTLMYAVSNVIFLLLLCKPIGLTIERIRTKYNI